MFILGIIIGLIGGFAVYLFFNKYAIVERSELAKCQKEIRRLEE